MRYGGFSYTEAYYLPVNAKRWFLKRIKEEIEKQAKAQEKSGGNSGINQALLADVMRTQMPFRGTNVG